MTCLISNPFHGHLPLNSPPSSRLVSPACQAYPAGSGKPSIRRAACFRTGVASDGLSLRRAGRKIGSTTSRIPGIEAKSLGENDLPTGDMQVQLSAPRPRLASLIDPTLSV